MAATWFEVDAALARLRAIEARVAKLARQRKRRRKLKRKPTKKERT